MAWRDILKDDKYNDRKRLARHGFKVYSQTVEDGIIQKIFNRIGAESRSFIEIGAGDGQENNDTLFLLQQSWRGAWIDGDPEFRKKIFATFPNELESGSLIFQCTFLDKDNIDSLLTTLVPHGDIDFLSIDVDGKDYP